MNPQETLDTISQAERIGRQIYKGFNERNLDLWDEVIAPDVELRSSIGTVPMIGLEPLKGWAAQFQSGFQPRLDLVDKVTRFWVADHTMDLTLYLIRERGMHYPQNFVPDPIIRGEEPSKFVES